jgi:tetratricopeptide (TPR) repeat protein/energy-coupling factor transporter ATP-binding protein EcfA2
MSEGVRSPFGKLLRAYWQQRGLSQAGLADLITQRNLSDPEFARLGVVTEKAIANLESASRPPSRWVRPRPQTVSLFLAALEIQPGSREEQAFLAAAEEARNRVQQQTNVARQPNIFVPEGRESQLRQLKAAWAKARSGEPEFVLIAGDAGTGKTRLIQHMREFVQAQDHSVLLVVGECTPGANAIEPYQPFLHAFNQMLGLSTSEITPELEIQARDNQMINTLLTLGPGLIGPLVNESALLERIREMGEQGQELSEIASRYRALHSPIEVSTRLDQVVRFVTRAAELQPLIIVLEDLHWADQRACTLLLHLQRQLLGRSNVPLLVIGSYRANDLLADEDGTRHPLRAMIAEMMRRSDDPVIDLSNTVGNERGRRFIDGLLRSMGIDEIAAEGLGEFLFERTEGHPLFAVELFRWLRDRRQLQKERDGTWKPASSVLMNNIPHKVLAMVAERIERLPRHLRRVVSVAAAQGQNFSIEVLASAASLSEEDLASVIDDELVAHHRLLIPTGTETYAGQITHRYAFSHAMFQEYLYSSMSGPERKRLHGMIAEAIIDVLGIDNDAAAAEAALHFSKAEKFQEAGFYAYMAGAHATQQMEYDVGNEWFERSIEYAGRAKDMARVGRARNGVALIKRRTGQFDEGIRLANQVLLEAQQRGYANLEGECHTQLGQFYYDLSESETAEYHLRRASEIYKGLDNRFDLSGVESMLSHTAYRKGRYDDALAHARISGRLSAELNNDHFTAEALLAAGNCENDLGMYQKAIDTYQQAVTYYRSAGDHRGELLCTLNSGLANIQIKEYDEAILILNQAMDMVMRRRLDRYVPFVATYLGLAYEGRGDLERAAEHFRTARDRRRDSGLGGLAQDNVAGMLRIATARKDHSAMLMHARELQDWFSKQGASGLEDPLTAYLSLAIAQEALGDAEQSRDTIRAGYELLMERANLLTDPDTVRSYLESVPTNNALRARYAALTSKRPGPIPLTSQDARGSGIAAP